MYPNAPVAFVLCYAVIDLMEGAVSVAEEGLFGVAGWAGLSHGCQGHFGCKTSSTHLKIRLHICCPAERPPRALS